MKTFFYFPTGKESVCTRKKKGKCIVHGSRSRCGENVVTLAVIFISKRQHGSLI